MQTSNDLKGRDGLFASRFRQLLKERNYTQRYVAEQTHSKGQTISQYVNGEVLPNAEKLYEIAKCLDVSADYLIGLSDTTGVDITNKEINKMLGLSEYTIMRLHDECDAICKIGKSDLPYVALANALSHFNDEHPYFWIINRLVEDEIHRKDNSHAPIIEIIGELLEFNVDPQKRYALIETNLDNQHHLSYDTKNPAELWTDNERLSILLLRLQQSIINYRTQSPIQDNTDQ